MHLPLRAGHIVLRNFVASVIGFGNIPFYAISVIPPSIKTNSFASFLDKMYLFKRVIGMSPSLRCRFAKSATIG